MNKKMLSLLIAGFLLTGIGFSTQSIAAPAGHHKHNISRAKFTPKKPEKKQKPAIKNNNRRPDFGLKQSPKNFNKKPDHKNFKADKKHQKFEQKKHKQEFKRNEHKYENNGYHKCIKNGQKSFKRGGKFFGSNHKNRQPRNHRR